MPRLRNWAGTIPTHTSWLPATPQVATRAQTARGLDHADQLAPRFLAAGPFLSALSIDPIRASDTLARAEAGSTCLAGHQCRRAILISDVFAGVALIQARRRRYCSRTLRPSSTFPYSENVRGQRCGRRGDPRHLSPAGRAIGQRRAVLAISRSGRGDGARVHTDNRRLGTTVRAASHAQRDCAPTASCQGDLPCRTDRNPEPRRVMNSPAVGKRCGRAR
jgi:hypothetical protein